MTSILGLPTVSLLGTAGNDNLLGDNGNNILFGLAGDDLLSGRGGNDVLDGGMDKDTLSGGSGMDFLLGGSEDDTLKGENDADVLDGGSGDDELEGGNDKDVLFGGTGMDNLFGNNGDDVLDGGDDADGLWGENGNDLLNGGSGDDSLEGGDGDDLLSGGTEDDFLGGGNGNDVLEGGDGNDALRGHSNNDLLIGNVGNDVLAGDTGTDTLDGGDGMDALGGGRGNDLADGGLGNDLILGEQGRDTLQGGAGSDAIDGDGILTFLGLTSQNTLVSIDPSDPSTVKTIQVTGVNGTLEGIDVRPANNLLYGITDTDKIYTIDFKSGAATLVSSLNVPFNAEFSGVDFNPVPDRFRVVGDNDQNFRINVATGEVADFDPNTPGIQPDRNLAYAAGDPNFGKDPNVTAVAYTNSFAPSPDATRTTTLYGIDTELDVLVRQGGLDSTPPSPNEGQLFTIGTGLGFDFDEATGFDIFSSPNGINIAAAVSNSVLYVIDLNTGVATNVGQVGDGTFDFQGFAQTLDQSTSGDDVIDGGEGNDFLAGGNGKDTIAGGMGDDLLAGNGGDDKLTGNDGIDRFSFGSNTLFKRQDFGVDEITDFTLGVDKIVLDQTTFGLITAADIALVANDAAARTSPGLIVYSTGTGNLFFNQNGALSGLGAGDQLAMLTGAPALAVSDFVIVP
ncbi:MAG: DUF4394 domain-containing protein [Microcoleaceae cyanobacterium]